MSEKLNKYRIKERLVRGFVIASGIPAAVAAVALIAMIIVALRYSNALKVYGFAQGDVGKAMTYFAESRSTMRGVIGYDDEAVIESLKASHTASIENFTSSFEALEKSMVSEENKKVYADITSKLPAYWALDNEIIVQGGVTDREQCAIAQERAINELAPLYEDINDDLIEIMDIKVDRGNSTSTILTVVCVVLAVMIAVIIFIAIFTSIKLGRNIAENISAPLIQLKDRLELFAEGDLSTPFPDTQTDDEVADIIGSAKDMSETLMFVIYDLEYILGEMSNSNFVIRSKDSERYKGEFRQIFDSLKQLRDNMVDTLRYIGMSSEQVSAGSSNLADTSQSLAEGATEQAGAVQELHATITTISEAARRAADSAEDAYRQSQEYANVADRSSDDMKEMVEAMSRISEASHKIGNIISEIENIASETNMLSLNASIEAARAGEAGRGFSVVADQIRQLAEQSSKSAVDTRALIEGTMREVENGNKVAERAVESLAVVVEGIRKVADSSKELSTISSNQMATMKEAELGVDQISDVIQTNAAVAEESSATSEELSAQAVSLDELIAKFVLPEK
ncbi:MAG: methyl-accepting chemotaxis protein [Lachnospiraceae bacterium]|nr:methyl-accepting chemotaxis protein [Lachnospiraceae bacterium]